MNAGMVLRGRGGASQGPGGAISRIGPRGDDRHRWNRRPGGPLAQQSGACGGGPGLDIKNSRWHWGRSLAVRNLPHRTPGKVGRRGRDTGRALRSSTQPGRGTSFDSGRRERREVESNSQEPCRPGIGSPRRLNARFLAPLPPRNLAAGGLVFRRRRLICHNPGPHPGRSIGATGRFPGSSTTGIWPATAQRAAHLPSAAGSHHGMDGFGGARATEGGLRACDYLHAAPAS